jgi:hypothetical protein
MKHFINKISVLGILSAAVIGLPACTHDFEEINTNPNTMVEGMATPYNMMEYLIYEPAQWLDHYGWYWHNELVQYTTFTGSSLRQYHIYKFSDGEFQTAWNANARFATNARHMYQLAESHDDNACRAIASTLEVMFIANQVSLFGDIPYSEAFLLRDGGTSQPKFDTQKEVFEQLFDKLEAANDIYNGSTNFRYPSLDGLFGGDMKKWQRFNNSMYLRLLMRVSGRSEMNVGEKMTEILANTSKYPIFRDNSDNATLYYSGVSPYVSYFYDANITKNDLNNYRFTEQMRKLMIIADANTGDDLYADPRTSIMYKMNNSSDYNDEGNWKGATSGGTQQQTSLAANGTAYFNYDLYVSNPTTPTMLMGFDELEFILAEAAYRGLIPGGEAQAKTYYLAALEASLDRWIEMSTYLSTPAQVTDDEREYFLDNDLTTWDRNDNKLKLIAEQKFIALFMVGFEGFNEIRRTGYPELTIGAGTVYNDYQFPTRFAYPATTLATNNANCNIALERMGGSNNMHTNLWWSKAAIASGK